MVRNDDSEEGIPPFSGRGRRHGGRGRSHKSTNPSQGLRGGRNSSAVSVDGAATLTDNVSLTKFTRFKDIPAELRLKIWGMVAREERIIELEHEFGPGTPDDGIDYHDGVNRTHEKFQVTKRSSRPPALIEVNAEAREEGLKFYQLCTVCNGETKNTKVYFNKDVDIIYFGEQSCVSTIIFLLRQGSLPFTRVAISCSKKMETCCEWNRAVFGGATPLQALHGMWRPDIIPGDFPGCPGLKEVFWITKSRYLPLAAGEVDASIGFRAAVGDGLTTGQIRYKKRMVHHAQSIKDDEKLDGVGEENKWLGDKKPKFSFKCLAPKTYGDEVHDSIIVEYGDIFRLGKMKGFLASLERKHSCRITIPPQVYAAEKERAIGFFGTNKAIDKVKNKIIETLGHPPLHL
ncbi:hypothetical protein B7494_g601 [Chlorociboria aeruginascens]|nr:hypothetical protein B7494_g601 [Chlorociboria aeruginascens]